MSGCARFIPTTDREREVREGASGAASPGYTSAPTVQILPSTSAGSGASATAVITNGKVTGFTSIVGGSNYSQTYPPEVRLTSNISVGAAPTSTNIVGTARVRSLQLESGLYNTTSSIYKLGLFDVTMEPGRQLDRDVNMVAILDSSATTTSKSYKLSGTFRYTGGVANSSVQIQVDSRFTFGSIAAGGSGTLTSVTTKGSIAGTPIPNLFFDGRPPQSGTSLTNKNTTTQGLNIGEVIMYNSALTPSAVTSVEKYLRNKWGNVAV